VANLEKDIAEQVLAASGLSPVKLGLRFDRVVGRVLGDLRAFSEGTEPHGVTVLVTLTAPIRLPARTVEALRVRIGALLAAGATSQDEADTIHGNQVRLRLVNHAASRPPKLVGFVHNPDSDPGRLLDLAERWLRS
jgi:hypothetical protein